MNNRALNKIKKAKMFTSYIIAETNLGVQCAEILLADGHQILGMISNSQDVIKLAARHNIPYFLNLKEFEKTNSYKTFDYLFIVVNSQIILPHILEYPCHFSINFHDAPLPKYAGVHATSWSILNDEKTHGISWHVMRPLVEAGEVIKQAIFPIEPDETALTLNLKCYIEAINTFKSLVKDIGNGTIHKHPQDLQQRSYYGAHQKPQSSGIIDWNIPAQEIDRLYGALYFGNYPNTLTAFKMVIVEKIFFPHKLEILNKRTKVKCWTIVKIEENAMHVSTKTEDVLIKNITDMQGNVFYIFDLVSHLNLYEGYNFPILNKKRKELCQKLTDLSPHENYWMRTALHSIPAKFPRIPYKNNKHEKGQANKKYSHINNKIDNDIIVDASTFFKGVPFVDILSVVFMIYIYRLGNKEAFYIEYTDPSIKIFTEYLDCFLSPTVPFRVDLSPDSSGKAVLVDVMEEKNRISKYKTYSLDIIERNSKLNNIHYNESDIRLNLINKNLESKNFQPRRDFFLEIDIDVKGNKYSLVFSEDIIEEEKQLIGAIPGHINTLLKSLVKEPDKAIHALSLLTSSEQNKLLYAWNATDKAYPDDKTIHQLFEEQVEKTPDNVAVVYEGNTLTYRELNTKANQLAHTIRQRHTIHPDTLIGLCLDRSEHMLVGILAVLKAGGAYVPMDPGYPDERIRYIVGDTETSLVLTNACHQERLARLTAGQVKETPADDQAGTNNRACVDILAIDEGNFQESLSQADGSNPETETRSTHLAYVIYTSGTTGHPKGVMIEHKGVVNLSIAQGKEFNLTNTQQAKNCLWYSNYVFDAHVSEVYITILTGHTLHILNNTLRHDIKQLSGYIQQNKIEIATIPPALLDTHNLLTLKTLIVAGDKTYTKIVDYYLSYEVNIINAYGPTESTVCATLNHYQQQHSSGNIGSPILNTRCYVLSDTLTPLPIGVIGELYIGGVGLARGYLNNPGLTAERFIANPFQTREEQERGTNSRLYKTGDLVRWLPDGNLDYIGRNDFQVKIRGYRIELGEIESALSSYEGITQSVVLAREHVNQGTSSTSSEEDASRKYLVGYYVSERPLDEVAIIRHLQARLPEYMVPQVLMHLPQLPLTLNGKLDRKALPEPSFIHGHAYCAPRTEVEQKLVQIWSEVLGLPADQVGIQDDFFRLGGNSILAIRLMTRLNKALGVYMSIATLFKQTTIEKLTYYLMSHTEEAIVMMSVPVERVTEQALSFAQERLWFIEKYEEGSNAYHIPMIFKLSPTVDLSAFITSINALIDRHEILRTLIKEDANGTFYQCVMAREACPSVITTLQVSNQSALDAALATAINRVYDLSQEFPIRVCLYEFISPSAQVSTRKQTNANNQNRACYVSIVLHHIAFDGWSAGIFLRELETYYRYYNAQAQGEVTPLALPALPLQYKDFALWQRHYLSGERLESQLAYWKKKLDGYETLALLTDRSRPQQIDYAGKDIFFKIDEETSRALREVAKSLHVSLYSLLLSVYALMLRAYSHQDDIMIGTPVANRHYSQLENMIGFFVNTLALRIQIDPSASLKSFIQQVMDDVVSAQLHQDIPFEKVVDGLDVPRDPSRHPLFQVMFMVTDADPDGYIRVNKDKAAGEEGTGEAGDDSFLEAYRSDSVSYEMAKFDISTMIDTSQACLTGSFNYAVGLYDETTINRFIETYCELLTQIAACARVDKKEELKVSSLQYLGEEQAHTVLYAWNATDKAYPDDKTIHQLFEEQVEKTPDNVAVVYEGNTLTYRELNTKANQLAHTIRQRHTIHPDTLIGLCLDRSEHMLIGILAVLKAGGAYVPMDPGYPDERIRYIVGDTETLLILTNACHQERLARLTGQANEAGSSDQVGTSTRACVEILAIDEARCQEALSQADASNPKTETRSTHLAYVIYTSGTTGNPKGVMIEHKGVVNRITWMNDTYPLEPLDKILHKTPYVFDVSVWELFWAHWYGASVVIASAEKHKDAHYIVELMQRESITIVHFVPSMLSVFNAALREKKSSLPHLHYLFCSGEALTLTHVQECHTTLPNMQIHNLYGPTEASIDVLFYDCTDKNIKNICIGTPIYNTSAYVLSSDLTPLPIGELYIGGVGLARGYLNNPGLTAERFIANPFQTREEQERGTNSRLYKTGDLVRWLPDGNLDYIGRNDFQVKIRGYRIELGEIEAALSNYDGITQSVVLSREHVNQGTSSASPEEDASRRYLVGYYVSERPLDEGAIIRHLQARLPEYMVPQVLMHLPQLPLTLNGKLDRKALPEPSFIHGHTYIAPRTEVEQRLVQIWSEVLGLAADQVGIQDDFFRLGGDSIVSIQLVSRLRQRLDLHVTVKDIFNARTIERLSDVLSQENTPNTAGMTLHTEEGVLSGAVPLLPIQECFFSLTLPQPHHWNQAFLVKTPPLDDDRLHQSIAQLVTHHDVFSLRYQRKAEEREPTGSYHQYYHPDMPLKALKTLDITTLHGPEGTLAFEEELSGILTTWQNDFALEEGALYRIGYLYGYADGSSRVWFALHHLIVDAVSWRILADDLRRLYEGKTLGSKGSSYRQWSEVVGAYSETHATACHINTSSPTSDKRTERDYWHNVANDYAHHQNATLSQLVTGEETHSSAQITFSHETTRQFLRESHEAYHTQVNDLLLTALAYTLHEVNGGESAYIVLEGHGREEIDPRIDISRTVGWFTTMYPVKLEVAPDGGVGSSLKNIKENVRQIPNKGIGYGAIIGYTDIPLPRISFNYLGQLDQEEKRQQDSSESSWSIVGECAGEQISPLNTDSHILTMNGAVLNGVLQFTFSAQFTEAMTTKIAHLFKEKLEEVIAHTINQTRRFLTASDVGNIIHQDYVDSLQKERDIEGVYLANSLQQGFVYHALTQGDVDDAYRVQLIWQYPQRLAVDHLKEAWQSAQRRYSSLRLRFAWENELVQIIDREGTLDWRYVDMSHAHDPETQESCLKQIQAADREEIYHLEKGNLFRVYVIKQREDLYTCLFSSHHSILDGWSNPIVLGYVHDVYGQLLDNKKIVVSVDCSYEDAQAYLQDHREEHHAYWANAIAQVEDRGDLSGLLLPAMKAQGIRISDYRHIKQPAEATLIIKDKLYRDLKEVCQQEGVTLNAVLQYVWHKALSIYGHSCQTVVGTTVSGRNIPVNDIEQSVGLYINTLPLIVNHSKDGMDQNLIASIKDLQETLNEMNSRSNISLSQLQQGGERLFESLFVYENYPTPVNSEQDNRINVTFKEAIEKIDYPLGVVAYETDKKLTFTLKYAGELFGQETIEQIVSVMKTMLVQITNNPYGTVESLNYLTKEQAHKVLYAWNATDKAYPDDKTIHQLFEEQVEKTPDNVAVVYEGNTLTYRELNTKANQLAHTIRQRHTIHPDTLIGLCLDRSEHMLVGILAVLKAGGAYVPMDPGYPDERIRYIVGDTETLLILTNACHQERLARLTVGQVKESPTDQEVPNHLQFVAILAIDEESFQESLSTAESTNPETETGSTHLAYVIYTSGTTGNPKGVMIEHKGVVNLSIAQGKELNLTNTEQSKNSLWYSNYVFDAHVWEVYITILTGHTLHILKEILRHDLKKVSAYIQHNKIEIATIPPVLLDTQNLLTLNTLIVAGDKTDTKVIDYYLSHGIKIINAYGPTESTVCATLNHYDQHSSTTIGSPIFNTRCYVFSDTLTLLPIGAIGELYIGGVGLARGYLNKPGLTAERFIANPFQTREEQERGTNSRLYKTGDLVRWLPDGNLDYIERNDFQVKIRGYRIELGEIEAALSHYESITQSVVLAKEQVSQGRPSASSEEEASRKYLVGYYVAERALDEGAIIRHLQARLPEYMVPQVLMHLPQLPLTLNGKLDRKALPEPSFIQGRTYVAPRSEVEQKLVQIWSEVLGLPADQVGIQDDFFRLGGNSILAIRLVSKVNKLYQCCLKVSDIFIYKIIESMIHIINDKNYYIPIIKLNNSQSKKNMFMIHPGRGGCEVYSSLAAALAHDFICYGIDPYNLYNEHKIDNLHELAKYYLKHINETIIKNNIFETYNLFGWSLGGYIALEIASILEKEGHKNINVYLLDTIIKDNFLIHLENELKFKYLKNKTKENMLINGNDTLYIEKFLANMDIEKRILEQKIYSTLNNTSILLFKAMLGSVTADYEKSNGYVKNLHYNNIDSVIGNIDNINLIKIENANHENILIREEIIVSEIRCFLNSR